MMRRQISVGLRRWVALCLGFFFHRYHSSAGGCHQCAGGSTDHYGGGDGGRFGRSSGRGGGHL